MEKDKFQISLMWNEKEKKNQTKAYRYKEPGWWLSEGRWAGEGEMAKGVNGVVTDGNWTFGGERAVLPTEVEI